MAKKLLVITMGLILMLGCFTACGSKNTDKEEPTQTAEETAKDSEKTEDKYVMTWHDLKFDIDNAIANEVSDEQLNVAIDGYMITVFYLPDGGEMKDSDKSLHKYIEGFEGTVDETSEVEMNKTKVGVATYTTKDGIKSKLYLFTLKNKNAYSICATYHKGDDNNNAKSIEVLDKAMEKISWVNSTKKPVEPEEPTLVNIDKNKDIEYSFTYSVPEGYVMDEEANFTSYGSKYTAYFNHDNFDKNDPNSLKMICVNIDGFCNSEEEWNTRMTSDGFKDVKDYTTKNGIKGKLYQTEITEFYEFSFYNKGCCTITATDKDDLMKVVDTLK